MAKKIEVKPQQISLKGSLDIFRAPELKMSLLKAVASGSTELDLHEVDLLDTAGLQVLVLAKREAGRLGHDFRIIAHSPEVQETLNLCGMVGWFGGPLLIPAQQAATRG